MNSLCAPAYSTVAGRPPTKQTTFVGELRPRMPVPYICRITLSVAPPRSIGTGEHVPFAHSKIGSGVWVPSAATRTAAAAGTPEPLALAVNKPGATGLT